MAKHDCEDIAFVVLVLLYSVIYFFSLKVSFFISLLSLGFSTVGLGSRLD